MNRMPVQIASVIVIVTILVMQVAWMIKHPGRWRWSVPVFLWMLHGLVFYLTLFFTDWPHTTWSAILRLHGYVSVLIVEAARLRRGK